MYNIENLKDRRGLLRDITCLDIFPKDATRICEAVPSMIEYVEKLELMIVNLKSEKQKVEADLREALRKNNNLNSQKVRHLKKKGKY